MRIIILLFSLSFIINSTQAKISGSLIEMESNLEIPFGTVINYSLGTGVICDEYGNFNIDANLGDTIIIQTLGYLAEKIIVTDSMLTSHTAIQLKTRLYDIDEAKIIRFRDYESFKLAFKNLELPTTKTDILRKNIQTITQSVAIEADLQQRASEKLASNSVGVGIPILSKADKDLIKIKALEKKQSRWNEISRKYNRDIVRELTNYEDEELTDFIIFCNFTEEFLFKALPEDIAYLILKKMDEFEAAKKEGYIIPENYYPEFYT